MIQKGAICLLLQRILQIFFKKIITLSRLINEVLEPLLFNLNVIEANFDCDKNNNYFLDQGFKNSRKSIRATWAFQLPGFSNFSTMLEFLQYAHPISS